MTLVEAYHHARRLEAAPAVRVPGAALSNAAMLGALGCLWAGAFALRYGWF
jgi:hypothetical protein